MTVHAEYAKLFSALNSQEESYCLLRDEIEHGELVGDLDLLIDERSKAQVLRVFDELGYRIKISDYLLPFKMVLVKFLDGAFVVIDLHLRVVQNGVLIMNTDKVLNHRRTKGMYFLPAIEDFATLLVLHNILGKKCLQEKHVPVLHQLIKASSRELLQSRQEQIVPANVASVLNPLFIALQAGADEIENVEQVHQQLMNCYHDSDKTLKSRLTKHRWRHFRRRWSLRPRAPVYALTGVDGVGKTSLNNALLNTLNQPGGFPAITEYMGPWGHYRIPWMGGGLYSPGWSLTTRQWWQHMVGTPEQLRPSLATTLGTVKRMLLRSPMNEAEANDHARVRAGSRLFLTLRYLRSLFAVVSFMTLLTAEMYYRYFIVYKHRRRGVTVITDRYVYDLMTGRMHEMMPHYYRIRAFLCRVFPKPTKVFLLYNDIETILQRKADLAEPVMKEFMALYDELALKHGFEKFKTNKDPQTLANQFIAKRFDEIVAMTRYH